MVYVRENTESKRVIIAAAPSWISECACPAISPQQEPKSRHSFDFANLLKLSSWTKTKKEGSQVFDPVNWVLILSSKFQFSILVTPPWISEGGGHAVSPEREHQKVDILLITLTYSYWNFQVSPKLKKKVFKSSMRSTESPYHWVTSSTNWPNHFLFGATPGNLTESVQTSYRASSTVGELTVISNLEYFFSNIPETLKRCSERRRGERDAIFSEAPAFCRRRGTTETDI